MKSKPITYLLIGVVLLIWGLVFYRLFSATQDEETFAPLVGGPTSVVKVDNLVLDSFDLLLDYRDPFLGRVQNSPSISKPNKTITMKRTKVTVMKDVLPPIDWSFISYKGAITNKLSKKEIGIFKIHNSDAMMTANESNGEITILKISRDSALILYKGVKKGIKKEY